MNYFDKFLQELNEAPDYVKENVMCYFWHNTGACTKCPKTDCKVREPRRLEPSDKRLSHINVSVCDHYWFSVPNPKTDYELFCHVIKQLGRGEYVKLFNPPAEKPPVLNEKEREEFIKKLGVKK